MKAYEFPTKVAADGRLELPESLLKQLPSNQEVRVILLVSEPEDREEHAAWSRLTGEQFLAGYNEVDAIYDQV
jgi:hypothetical protein